jgi:hypothetical protein
MIYEQYPYNIYNPAYVNPDYLQQLELQRQQMEQQRKHWEQQKKIGDMVKAISDYFDAARKIEPEYQQEAISACLIELARQASIDQQQNGGIK